MNGFDLSTISNCYLGGTQMSAIYYGSRLIWPSTPPVHDYSQDYLTFEALEETTFALDNGPILKYSLDNGTTWSNLYNSTPTVSAGQKILWKWDSTNISTGIGTFTSHGAAFNVSGNIMSLLYEDNFVGQTSLLNKNDLFSYLFDDCKIINAKNLVLPATTLTDSCYAFMFSDCTDLISVPKLPATTLAPDCYEAMFMRCSSLAVAPALPATTIPSSTNTLGSGGCYDSMFKDCKSLTIAPILPATNIGDYAYRSMFNGCSNLDSITCLATDISATGCTTNWLYGVATTGTFTKAASMNNWTTGASGIPSGWTTVNAS